jgi:hypothetical protein
MIFMNWPDQWCVCSSAVVRSFLHSSEEYTGDRASKSKVYDSQRTPLCPSDRDRRDTDVDVSENEILFLHYYHINQPSISKATAHFNTDKQTDRSIRDWCEALYPYRSNAVLHPLTYFMFRRSNSMTRFYIIHSITRSRVILFMGMNEEGGSYKSVLSEISLLRKFCTE